MNQNSHRLTSACCFSTLLLLVLPLCSVAQSNQVLTVSPVMTEHHKYCLGLLKLALSYSGSLYEFDYSPGGAGGRERELIQLDEGTIDIMWTATSEYMETQARAIRVPLYRGLLGHRILLIRQGDQHRFQQVKTLDDLKKFTFGQGGDWADTAILKANHLKVVPAHGYESLFHMLDGGRFDAFPRGIHEPWSELNRWKGQLNLAVEETLAIHYKMPMYFFVSKNNKRLGDMIEQGLYKAIDDGAFDNYLFNNAIIKEALEHANLRKRKIFYLDNPNLPAATPLDNPTLWWSPDL